jgi:SHS2 domain-containing protein
MRPYARSEEHVGESKLTLWADTLEDLFAEAARVLARACGPASGAPGDWEQVCISARDTETLLIDWLNELLGRSEVAGRAYGEIRELTIADGRLEAEVRGRPVASWRSAIKAATYHGLQLVRQGDRWRAVVLLDV